MDSAPENPKPKRHYTVTDKVRAARRLSLAKAREKAKHALRGYKRGDHEDDVAYNARLDRQITPWRANLRHAVAAHKADRSAHYASHFTHGLTAPDLDRSAAAAGEDREELRQHVERCQETIGGLIDDCRLTIDDCQNRGSEFGVRDSADSNPEHRNPNPELTNRQSSIDNRQFDQSSIGNRQSKIILALAYVFWRTLRLLRTQIRWERRALAFRLQELAGWRERNPELTAERLNQFRNELDLVTRDVTSAWPRLRKLRQRFEALWTALFDPERWERLADHIRNPSQVPNEATFMPEGLGFMDLVRASIGGSGRCGAGFQPASRRSAGKACPEQSEGMPAPQDGGDGDSPDLDSECEDRAEGADRPERPPRVRGPRNPFNAHFDPLAYLCRTRAHGAQDWRLRLDELRAETLSDPFQSPANVEGALEGQAAAAEVAEGREAHKRRRGDSRSEAKRRHRVQNPSARIPDDKLLEALAAIGMLADLNSLAEVSCWRRGWEIADRRWTIADWQRRVSQPNRKKSRV